MSELPTRVIMLKVQVTMVETGYPAPYEIVKDAYGKHIKPAVEEGLWWIGATPKSYRNIKERGLDRQGTLTRSFIPPGLWPHEGETHD